jgi:hypothetical protein
MRTLSLDVRERIVPACDKKENQMICHANHSLWLAPAKATSDAVLRVHEPFFENGTADYESRRLREATTEAEIEIVLWRRLERYIRAISCQLTSPLTAATA